MGKRIFTLRLAYSVCLACLGRGSEKKHGGGKIEAAASAIAHVLLQLPGP